LNRIFDTVPTPAKISQPDTKQISPAKLLHHKWFAILFDAHKAKGYRPVSNWPDNSLRRFMPASAVGFPYDVREIK
jgi:hypothetical protein